MNNNSNHSTPFLKSVDKALAVLNCFTEEKPEYTLIELSRKLGVSKGTIHRILITAQRRGYIEQNSMSGKYQLGLKIFELGKLVQRRMNLRQEAYPIINKVAEKIKETVYLIVKYENDAVCILRKDGNTNIRILQMEEGTRMPLHVGAGPRILLSYMSDEEINKWLKKVKPKKLTEYTEVDTDRIWKNIYSVREKGYIISSQDANEGVAAVGAPIRNSDNQVIASFSIAGLDTTFKEERLEEIKRLTIKTAEDISYRMGWIK